MITNEFNDSVLKKIENLSAKDIIQIFEQIGSEQLTSDKSAKEISTVIHEELERYGVIDESLKVNEDYIVAPHKVYDGYAIEETFEYPVHSVPILAA